MAAAGAIYSSIKAQNDFERDVGTFDDVEAVPRQSRALRTRASPQASVHATGGGKNNPERWDVLVSVAALAARTGFTLSREGVLGGLREKLSIKDIHVGDASFDGAFCIRGTDEDVVRGVFAQVEVQDTIRALFSAFDVKHMQLSATSGTLSFWLPRPHTNATTARDIALMAHRVASVLEQRADIPALLPPARTNVGMGSNSGASVAISALKRD